MVVLGNELVVLEPADAGNVDLLIRWTRDPVAQGPHKRVPDLTPEALRRLILAAPDRHCFLIRRAVDGKPLGRFYWRAWRFGAEGGRIDWELNILLAVPAERGRGYGTAVQRLAADHLLALPATASVFAYTATGNVAEQRALEKAGFTPLGPLPHPYYRIEPAPPGRHYLYARQPGPHG